MLFGLYTTRAERAEKGYEALRWKRFNLRGFLPCDYSLPPMPYTDYVKLTTTSQGDVMQKQTQDRFGQYFREGDSISVCGTVVEINEPLITVLIEDVGTPGYVPLRIVVNAKQCSKGN
jgi:hypothetical protein